MNTAPRTPIHIVKTSDDTFDTTRIVATINRLLSESAGAHATSVVVDLTVLGHAEAEPAHIYAVSRMLYRESNCTVSIPVEMDAGALRGLEAGIAAD